MGITQWLFGKQKPESGFERLQRQARSAKTREAERSEAVSPH